MPPVTPPDWWEVTPRDAWLEKQQQRLPEPPEEVRKTLRYAEEAQAAYECRSIGVRYVVYR